MASTSSNGTVRSRKKRELIKCKRCDYDFDSYRAKCPQCGFWNAPEVFDDKKDQTILLSEASEKPLVRIETGPWDVCFGGGLVVTSVTLLGGAPGAGKSTMALQLADNVCEISKREILYIGMEEAVEEIKYRAIRLGVRNMHRIRVHPMGSNAQLGSILLNRKPAAIIVDSLPGMTLDANDAVEICKRFKDYSVTLEAPTIIIDHVTKDHDFAGLMQLQHAVDTTVSFFPRDEASSIRDMFTIKNRFGPANVSAMFEMTAKGLVAVDEDEEEEEEDE